MVAWAEAAGNFFYGFAVHGFAIAFSLFKPESANLWKEKFETPLLDG